MHITTSRNADHPLPAFTLTGVAKSRLPGGARRSPFVFASPHSGRFYPERLQALSMLSEHTLRRSEDAYVDQLFEPVADLSIPLLVANYPRVYVDLNRNALELDARMFSDPLPNEADRDNDRVIAGFGVIPRVVTADRHIYKGPLSYKQERARISDIYAPYHGQLAQLIGRAKMDRGWAVLIDCHSMPSLKSPVALSFGAKFLRDSIFPRDPDIVLGDRFGRSCSPRLMDTLEKHFEDKGYSVARNEPYAGGYCTEHYGDPINHVHALQIEINRKLYMDEATITPIPDAMTRIKADLSDICAKLCKLDLSPGHRIAAE